MLFIALESIELGLSKIVGLNFNIDKDRLLWCQLHFVNSEKPLHTIWVHFHLRHIHLQIVGNVSELFVRTLCSGEEQDGSSKHGSLPSVVDELNVGLVVLVIVEIWFSFQKFYHSLRSEKMVWKVV